MKNRIATIIACSLCAITLSGCHSTYGTSASVSIVEHQPVVVVIKDLPPRPYHGEVAGNLISNRFND